MSVSPRPWVTSQDSVCLLTARMTWVSSHRNITRTESWGQEEENSTPYHWVLVVVSFSFVGSRCTSPHGTLSTIMRSYVCTTSVLRPRGFAACILLCLSLNNPLSPYSNNSMSRSDTFRHINCTTSERLHYVCKLLRPYASVTSVHCSSSVLLLYPASVIIISTTPVAASRTPSTLEESPPDFSSRLVSTPATYSL